jgi:hypothetical protein
MKKVLELVVKYVNVKGLVKDLVNEVADEALQKVVDGTKKPLDNAAKAALWPVLEEELGKIIDENLDLEKILLKKEEPKA